MKTRPRPRTFVTLIAWAPVVLVTGIAALWLVFVASWKGRQIDQLEQATDRFVLRVTTWEERGVVLLLPGSFRNIDVKAVGGHWVTLIEDRHDDDWGPDLADLELGRCGRYVPPSCSASCNGYIAVRCCCGVSSHAQHCAQRPNCATGG
jgi:hypothetical protein